MKAELNNIVVKYQKGGSSFALALTVMALLLFFVMIFMVLILFTRDLPTLFLIYSILIPLVLMAINNIGRGR